MMKTIETERLIIRPIRETDVDAMFAYAKKPNIGPMAGWQPHQSIEETQYILRRMIKEKEVWAITIKPSDVMVGTIGLHQRSIEHALLNKREIGYVLDTPYWGQGIMVEAVQAMLDYGFNELGLSKIHCGHKVSNTQSQRVIEKTGFIYTHDETRDDHVGLPVTIKMYTLKKNQYRRMKK